MIPLPLGRVGSMARWVMRVIPDHRVREVCVPVPHPTSAHRRRRARRSLLSSIAAGSALAVAAGAWSIAGDTAARDRNTAAANDDAVASVAVLVPDPSLDPRIAALEFSGVGWQRAVDRFDDALFAVADAERKITQSTRELIDLRAEDRALDRRRTELRALATDTSDELDQVEAILRERALDRFVNLGDEMMVALEDPAELSADGRGQELGRRIEEVQFESRAELLDLRERTDEELEAVAIRATEVGAELDSTQRVVASLTASLPRLEAEVESATAAVRTARWTASIPGVDFSVVALDAYLNAEDLLAEVWPSCNIDWWMIAGVARIESRHGRYGGRELRADGRVDRPIIGIALDGGPGVRAMVDTDGGRLDGDDVWDRAVGPLQFIPETWRNRGRDGSGDDVADPQNLYDAAYSAGRYLCAIGDDLSSRSALESAYFGYNNSSAYVEDVLGHALRYAEFDLPSPADAPDDPDA